VDEYVQERRSVHSQTLSFNVALSVTCVLLVVVVVVVAAVVVDAVVSRRNYS
jgi:cytochrome b